MKGADFVCDHCLKHGLVQAQVRDDLLELAVPLLKPAQPPQFRRPNAAVLLASDVEGASLMPNSACFSANAIWFSVNLLFLTTCSWPVTGLHHAGRSVTERFDLVGQGQRHHAMQWRHGAIAVVSEQAGRHVDHQADEAGVEDEGQHAVQRAHAAHRSAGKAHVGRLA